MVGEALRCENELQPYLYDMVLEVNILFLLSASILYVQYTDKISSPASYKPVEYL